MSFGGIPAPGSDGDLFYNNAGDIEPISYVTWDDMSPNMTFTNAWATFPGNSRVNYDSGVITEFCLSAFDGANPNAAGTPLVHFPNGSDGEFLGMVAGVPTWTTAPNPFDQTLNVADSVAFADVASGEVNIATGVHFLDSTTLGFFSASPVGQQANIADPTGGGTEDAEARAAINAILDLLQAFGLMAAP